MTSASLNFTSRRKIKSSFVDIRIVSRSDTCIRIRVGVDSKVLKAGDDYRLVLDGFDRGRHQRRTISNPAGEHLDFTDFPADASLRFKVRQIATGANEGLVMAATADIWPVDIEGAVQKQPFLVPELDDLGALPWRIEWDGDSADPRLVLNRKLEEKFGSWRDPVLQALYLPAMLRDLLTGLICRNPSADELDDDTLGGRIITFCKEHFETSIPSQDFQGADGVEEAWLAWVEECVMQFSETKWRKGQTLLDQMLEAA